jgi:enoyl-CoA hydratase/carnithine racemase
LKYIKLEEFDRVGLLTLNRADKHNAINKEFMYELGEILSYIEKSDLKSLIITSSGEDVFAAGGDIEYFVRLTTREDAYTMAFNMHTVLSRFENLKIPTVCAINGSCIGGGAELILAFDIRFLRSDSFIQFKEKELGVTTGWGGTYRLSKLIGHSKALRFLLSAEKIDAKKAEDVGLVDEIYDKDIVIDKAFEFCRSFADEELVLIKYIKRLSKEATSLSTQEAMDLERKLFSYSWMLGKREAQMKKFLNRVK